MHVEERSADPAGRWSRTQALVVGLCFAINMIDGMDVVIMSYVAPALAKDWQVAPQLMGAVFSAGLVGMALGGLFLAPQADRFGRRPVILTALGLMSAGMIASGLATSVTLLIAARVVVGCGIGAVLAAMAALAAETAPKGRQSFAVGVVQAGYPLAAVFTGLAAAHLLPNISWQRLLLAAGLGSVAMAPVALLVLPPGAPAGPADLSPRIRAVSGLFAGSLRLRTPLLWLAAFSGLMVLYFIVSWIPKLSIDAGLSETNGIYAGALYNLGAFTGTTAMSLLSTRVRLGLLIPVLLTAACGAMLVFGSIAMPVPATLFVAFLIGVTLQGGYNGLFPLAAGIYPAESRATGVGWAIAVGRGGAVLGPLIAGYLMAVHTPLPTLFAVYCVPLVVAALAAAGTSRR